MDIQIDVLKERKPSSVLLIDYFENNSIYTDDRFSKEDPIYELIEPAFSTGDF